MLATLKKYTPLLLVLFLLMIAANVIGLKKMPLAFADILTYNQLYAVKEQLHIKKIQIKAVDSISITFEGKEIKKQNSFEVYCDSALLLRKNEEHLVFKPLSGLKRYYIKINHLSDSIGIDIDYTPDSVYSASGNSSRLTFEIANADLLIQPGHLYNIEDWAVRFDKWSDSTENDKVEHYLRDSMHIGKSESDEEKVIKIAGYIFQSTKGRDGIPEDTMEKLSPLRQLLSVQSGKSRLWCGNYSTIFSFFAARAGIPVRIIECGRMNNSVATGIHVFNEVYLKDIDKWVYIDLTAKTLFVKAGETFLNVIDVQRLLRYDSLDSALTAIYFNGDSLSQIPFNKVSALARHYFHKDNSFKFYFSDYLENQRPDHLPGKVIKMFYTKPYYAIYADSLCINNSQFGFRVLAAYSLLCFLILFIFIWLFGFKRSI